MSSTCLNAYRLFLLIFAVWGGSGLFESLSAHFAWYRDPVAYAAFPSLPGAFNPWMPLTLLLVVATLVSGALLWRYRGPGRREALQTLAVAALVLLATFAFFVPELRRMFGEGSTLTEAELISHSRTWIVLNAVRIAVVLTTCFWGLVQLTRFAGGPSAPHEG